MTELRWQERVVAEGFSPKIELVLQYRTKELSSPVDDIWALQNGDNWRWTEWRDVPAEKS